MVKDNREYINKEKVKQTMLKHCRGDAIASTLWGAVTVSIMALITTGLYYLFPRTWFLWGLTALVGAGMFYTFFVRGLIGALRDRCLIMRGEFHVEQDYARAIDDDETNLFWDFLYVFLEGLWFLFLIPEMTFGIPYIHFSNKRRFAASQRTRDHATAGDPFYLVVLNNRKKKIAHVYNARFYRLDAVQKG